MNNTIMISDNHAHINPVRGLGAEEVAKRFKKTNGWFMCIVSLPHWSYGLKFSTDDYKKVFKYVIECSEILEKYGIRTARIIGVHPAVVEKMCMHVHVDKVKEAVLEIYEYAKELVKEGKVEGLGEVGRPHYPADRTAIDLCNQILDHVLTLSADLDCVVHLHVEQGNIRTIDDLSNRVKRSGARKVIFHHINPQLIPLSVKEGLIPSVPAKFDLLKRATKYEPKYVIESDFLDDPRRPGAVVAPWAISRTIKRLQDNNLCSSDYLTKILVENITKIYGISPK